MTSHPRKSVHELFLEGIPIDRALRQGARDALRRHKLLGQSIIVWRDGRVVEVPAEEIVVPPEEDVQASDR